MKKFSTKIILIVASIFSLPFGEAMGVSSFAQNVGINTTGNAPNSSALLDVNASPGNNKGILIPRLPLSATNSGTPISPLPGVAETGLMVYNTATAGVSPNDVVPGFYYWNGSAWAPLGGGGTTGGGWTDDGTIVRLTTSTDFVGIGTASPAATSALDISSTTKGILIPRMNTTQRDAIVTPATGLQIYNTDCKALNYWSGTCWISMSKALPSPGAITSTPASTVFCAGQSRTYTIAAVPGASSYTWTVPAGTTINSGQSTTSINATFGNISGNVCVDASNSCETSPVRCISVSVDPIPNTPGNITGITSINPGQTSVTYFVASVNGASTYTWSVPAGATIASGTGTTTIVVNFACTASSGNISVTANSTCGSSPASALALTITPLLSASAGSNVFGGVPIGGSPTASGGTTAYTYAWSPTADLSGSTVANPTALCTGSTTTYTVTVTDSRTCTATSSVLVTRNLTVSAGAAKFGGAGIGGSPTAIGGNPTYTYSWTPTANLSGSTIANPTALCSGATTTYTVTVTEANGCTGNSTVAVTRNLAASSGSALSGPGAIGGAPTATGGQSSYTYSWSPTSGLSSSTLANPTATACVNTTYTVTVTDANTCTAVSSGVTVTKNLTASGGANQSVTCAGVAIGGSPTATGGNATYSYSWNPTSGLSSSTVANPTAGACVTTTYTVTVTDANACTASSSMILTKNSCTVTFNYTGALQTWTVPSCITTITFDTYGAQGTANAWSGQAGGLGGRAQGTLAVAPGATINVYVGGQAGYNGGGASGTGSSCSNGAVGGGASDLRVGGTALANRVIVAGAGGGGGSGGCSWGGSAGGGGGGTTGSNGAGCCGGPSTGGTQAAGGNSSSGCGCGSGTAGVLGIGGNGQNASSACSTSYGSGSGGGGGYYGGGGGESCGSGWSGGGGSSYTGGVTGGATTAGVRSGNGLITISY